MTSIDDIKARIDAVDLISETVKLRRAGKNYTGFCPFHPNSRTPAFVVFPDSGTWRCFGQCNEGGDIFRFVMKKEGWDFAETLKYLADRAGVKLEPLTPQKAEQEEEHARLRALLEEAVTFYRHHLTTPAGETARAYLTKRGLTPATIETFGLGYAPAGWDNALRYFLDKGYSASELLQAGLVTERQEDSHPPADEPHEVDARRVYDRFRNRILFPIRDANGKMSGFGARILDPNDIPKFLNSPQTALFDKGRLLYGLDQARKAIRAEDQVVIVEGYLDVIVLHQGGFTNTVSPMGTALTEDQLRFLKRYTRRIVLALDADAAGEKATLRGLEVARQALDQSTEIVFDARGLLRNEARLQADLRVTTIPPGMDPDEVVLRDPEEWRRILADAQPVVIHVMDTLARSRDLDDAKVKSEIAAQVLPLIEDVPDAVERETYRQRLARLIKVDERALLGSGRPAGLRPRRKPSEAHPVGRPLDTAPAATPERRAQAMEAFVLRMLLQKPENLYLLDRSLQAAGLTRFDLSDFEKADHRLLAELLRDALSQDECEPEEFIQRRVPESLADLITALTSPSPFGDPAGEKLLEEITRTFLDLRLARVKEGLRQLEMLQRDWQESGEPTLRAYDEMLLQYQVARMRLEKALATPLQLD
jgi:DNA primase